MISVVIPVYNEQLYIQACLDSVLQQDCVEDMEVLIVDGCSTDQTIQIVNEIARKRHNIHLLSNPHKTAPYAMNIGIASARGEYVVRMDAHSTYPPTYISTLIHYLNILPSAQNVGACCRTLPYNQSAKCRAIAIASSHRFGIGGSAFRIGVDTITETDTVPFGCWRKAWLEQTGPFNTRLTRNQDDEFNARTIQNGGKIYLIPGIEIDYYARENYTKLWRMFYQYGLYKPLVNHELHHPATLRQFIPPLFVLFFPIVWALYLLIVLVISLRYRNVRIAWAFFVIHSSYGIGYWCGLYKLVTDRAINVEHNH